MALKIWTIIQKYKSAFGYLHWVNHSEKRRISAQHIAQKLAEMKVISRNHV